jgi:hypothetical protein
MTIASLMHLRHGSSFIGKSSSGNTNGNTQKPMQIVNDYVTASIAGLPFRMAKHKTRSRATFTGERKKCGVSKHGMAMLTCERRDVHEIPPC